MQSELLETKTESSLNIFKGLVLFFGLICGFLIVLSLWLNPHINHKIYMDNKVEGLINEYVQLGVDLNKPVECNSNAIKAYNQARNAYILISMYAPYTTQPKLYEGFLNSNKPITLQLPCEPSLQNKKSEEGNV